MTKKDYIKIADIINHETIYINNEPSIIDKNNFIIELCKMFKKDNKTFNEKKFKTYTRDLI